MFERWAAVMGELLAVAGGHGLLGTISGSSGMGG
jgi:hypothetical protein